MNPIFTQSKKREYEGEKGTNEACLNEASFTPLKRSNHPKVDDELRHPVKTSRTPKPSNRFLIFGDFVLSHPCDLVSPKE